ncbi:ABC transporter permease [Treponema sp. OMZ 840]|uniref:ABC transporter permease n=1 Tax=Treponema sp. OMZ 840 TaxID=244313 RepID=UPI003D906E11
MNNYLSMKTKNIQYRELGLFIFIVFICIFVQLRNPEFLTISNIKDLLVNTAILSILAMGMMLVLLTGGIDLSIGANIAFSGMLAALTLQHNPTLPVVLAVLEGMSVGAFSGLIIGILIAQFKILPIIASLGMMNILRGLTFLISRGKWVSAYQMPQSFKNIAVGNTCGINNMLLIAVGIYIIFWFFINHTRNGRWLYAVGSNREAAEISGIPAKKTTALAYVLMGILAGLGGVLWVAKFASAQGDTATGYEMNVIAACVLGGISVSGGSGKISGLILGTILFGILNNALPLINVSPFWQTGIQGLVILTAIITNVYVKRETDKNVLKRRII